MSRHRARGRLEEEGPEQLLLPAPPAPRARQQIAPPRFTGPTYSCVRCGSVTKVIRLSAEDLRRNGDELCQPGAYVNWRGHAQEFIPWPNADSMFSLVPILVEAS